MNIFFNIYLNKIPGRFSNCILSTYSMASLTEQQVKETVDPFLDKLKDVIQTLSGELDRILLLALDNIIEQLEKQQQIWRTEMDDASYLHAMELSQAFLVGYLFRERIRGYVSN